MHMMVEEMVKMIEGKESPPPMYSTDKMGKALWKMKK
jgi:hypothetical protein